MSKKKTTLEDFLDSYVKNREIKNGPLSYKDYVRNSGNEYKSDYYKERLDAAITNKGSEMGYGTARESLAARGLANSGYAEHLKSLAKERYQSTLSSVEDKHASAEARAKGKYYEYLRGYDEDQAALRKRVIEGLIDNEMINTDEAYNYAVLSGLSPDDALAATESAHTEVRRRLKMRVISQMFKRELSPDVAESYARELGLTDEDAADIGRIAEKYMHDYDGFTQEYIDYLESVGNKNTGTHP